MTATYSTDTPDARQAGAPHNAAPRFGVWEPELLTLFVRNQLRVGFAMPMIALFFAIAISTWTNWLLAASWFGSCVAAQVIQHYLCKVYEQGARENTASARVDRHVVRVGNADRGMLDHTGLRLLAARQRAAAHLPDLDRRWP
jgi:hypothetical protein